MSVDPLQGSAGQRSSTAARAYWRAQSRKALSAHIQAATQLCVAPGEVRLLPRADDPYRWEYQEDRRHLFSKHLSKHNIGAYRDLCHEVGKTFKAVPAATDDQNHPSPTVVSPQRSSGDQQLLEAQEHLEEQATTIDKLKAEISDLHDQLHGLQSTLHQKSIELRQCSKSWQNRLHMIDRSITTGYLALQSAKENMPRADLHGYYTNEMVQEQYPDRWGRSDN